MPMDGFTIGAMVYELNNLLSGARVDKINQPERDELYIFLRNNGQNHKLLLSSSAGYARICLTDSSKQNPPTPSSFCMLLRKHLTGAKITEFKQYGNERIIEIKFDTLNDFNDREEKKLILEIMGKHSNIIFCDASNKILDAIRHVNSLMSSKRTVLPGGTYVLPPAQDKLDPFCTFTKVAPVARIIADTYLGVSNSAAEEIEFLSKQSSFEEGFNTYIDHYKNKNFSPVVLYSEQGEALDFFAFEQKRFLPEFQKSFSTLSAAVDACFTLKDKALRIKEKTSALKNVLENARAKCERNQAKQNEKLLECADMEKYRVFGELITANIFKILRGDKFVCVYNYYTDKEENIALDNTISPQANAQRYFKKYNKLKTAKKLLNEQIIANDAELDFILSQLESLEKCESEDDILQIKLLLAEKGIIKQQNKKQKAPVSKPMEFLSSGQIKILVGKNNVQNDELTFKNALQNELWLHIKDFHGSHVIIKSEAPDNATIEQAAALAAFYSKTKGEGTCTVDATKRKYVKKISGAEKGKVTYTNQTTYYIQNAKELVKQIKRTN